MARSVSEQLFGYFEQFDLSAHSTNALETFYRLQFDIKSGDEIDEPLSLEKDQLGIVAIEPSLRCKCDVEHIRETESSRRVGLDKAI